jgi:hypothetical protein
MKNAMRCQLSFAYGKASEEALQRKAKVKVSADKCFWSLLFSGSPGMLFHQLLS